MVNINFHRRRDKWAQKRKTNPTNVQSGAFAANPTSHRVAGEETKAETLSLKKNRSIRYNLV